MSPAPRPAPKDSRPNRKGQDARGPKGSAAVKRALRGESVSHDPLLAFSRTNYLLMGSGVVLALIGFALLNTGDISVAPFLIVVGYCACIPAGILWRRPEAPRPGTGGGGSGAARTGE